MSKNLSPQRLRKYNFIASALHFVQGVAVLVLSKSVLLPLSGSYLEFDKATQSLQPTTTGLFDISLPLLVAIFFFMSSAAHLAVATIFNKQYNRQLARGMNIARWIEYSLSASVMIVAISLLVGIYDLMSLVMLFSLVAIMNLTGWIMESHNQTTKKTNWLSYWVGCLAGAIPWVVIAFTMWLGADNGSAAPSFVYWIFVSIFLFFNCFAVNMVLQYKKVGPWKDYIYGEFAYIILSLAAKSLLAWQVFAGALRP